MRKYIYMMTQRAVSERSKLDRMTENFIMTKRYFIPVVILMLL